MRVLGMFISKISSFLARHLSRQTSGRALIPEVDGLRSIAILSVVFFHANANFTHYAGETASAFDAFIHKLFESGEYGVPLFFAISGFILALPFASMHMDGTRQVSLKKYFVRRITRLEPPYIFALFALFVISALRTGSFEHFPNLFASSVYLHNAIYGEPSLITVVAWSLEVEVQFYILAPILTLVFTIKSPLIRRGILMAAIGAMSFFFGVNKPIDGLTVLNQGAYFLVGLLLVDFYLTEQRSLHAKNALPSMPRVTGGHLWDLCAIVSVALVFITKAYEIAPHLVSPWLILIAYTSVFRARYVRRVFRWSPIVILGGMCYTIYLWHFLFIAVFRNLWFGLLPVEPTLPHRLLYVLAASSAAIVLSAILFALIERPTMNPKWPSELYSFILRPFRSRKSSD